MTFNLACLVTYLNYRKINTKISTLVKKMHKVKIYAKNMRFFQNREIGIS